MIRLRIPVNLYNYRATIFGVEKRIVITLLFTALLALLIFRVSGSALSLLVLLPAVTIMIRTGRGTLMDAMIGGLRYLISSKAASEATSLQATEFNGSVIFRIRDGMFTLTEIDGINVGELRESDQMRLYSGIEKILNSLRCDFEFISILLPSRTNADPREGRSGWSSYAGETNGFRHFIRLSKSINNSDSSGSDLFGITASLVRSVEDMGFECSPVRDPEIIRVFAPSSASPDSSLEKQEKENTGPAGYFLKRNYVMGEVCFSDLYMSDAQYDLGPGYLNILESMQIPLAVRLKFERFGEEKAADYLKKMIAERKAELRGSGISFRNSRNMLKMQISDGERILNLLTSEGILPGKASLLIRVYADHPAKLADRITRIVTAFNYIGIRLERSVPVKQSTLNLLDDTASRVPNYLLNTRSVATIIPFLADSRASEEGIFIGFDDLTEMPVFLDIFAGASYNCLILGETGSGKTFFAKLVTGQYFSERKSENIIIFDPLEEYDCQAFGVSCKIVNLADGIAADSSLRSGEGNNPPHVLILRISRTGGNGMDAAISRVLEMIGHAIEHGDGRKIVILDECHLILRSRENSSTLDSLVRHSRHHYASIINISQNVDDFLNLDNNSIAYNSSKIFIFRNRSVKDRDHTVLKKNDFDIDPPETLAGGKGLSFSECIFSDGTTAKKVRIIGTERKVLEN